jgi:hypothetical protein
MDLRTLTTLAWRILAMYFCVQALTALGGALFLLTPFLGSARLADTWPVLAALVCYGALAAVVFLAGPRLTDRLAPGSPEPYPALDTATLVAVGLAVVGLAVGLDGFTEAVRQLPLLARFRSWLTGTPDAVLDGLGATLVGDPTARLVRALLRALGGGLLFLLAKPLARVWGRLTF